MGTNRSLLYIPVLHSPEDMGSFAASLGPSADYVEQVGSYWERVAAELRGLRRPWADARIYQDGLPDTRADIVTRIVSDVDSPNYRLVRWLTGRGAVVIGTEDPVLLQEEYELLKASVADDAARRAYAARAAGLLAERDRYIASRIDATLPEGGAGVLFVGMQHAVVQVLPPDITVTSPRCCAEVLPGIASAAARRGARGGRAR